MRLTHTSSENVCARTSELLNRRLAAAIKSQGQLMQAQRELREPHSPPSTNRSTGSPRAAEGYPT